MAEKVNPDLRTVTLTTASGHKFTYSYNVRTIANALVKLEQSQLYADMQKAREAGDTPPSADAATTE